eukprot:CAMPEP_0114112774 /NCGR_PEP_ID=MMETSP0043_2-20121206/2560_1 /TAXON_ID=464988 /ORGANISM="Hemiselmis andersenii, Strain CCMP644" /LENGTH=279 /DNA_ID=CAMNT_0001204883 /DNA_START=128 /DNA_END=963 /DNA_ORIENTATION=-
MPSAVLLLSTRFLVLIILNSLPITGSHAPRHHLPALLHLRGGGSAAVGLQTSEGGGAAPGEAARRPRISSGAEIDTGGLGSLTFGNCDVGGQTVSMVYENGQEAEGSLSALVVGNTRAVIQGKDGVSRVTEDGWAVGDEDETQAVSGRAYKKNLVYFEAGKSGAWKQVAVPRGMTDQQLLRKMKQQREFIEGLSIETRKVFEEEMEHAKDMARAKGLTVVSPDSRHLDRRIVKKQKEKEKARRRYQDKVEAVKEDIETRAKERDANRQSKTKRGWAGKS